MRVRVLVTGVFDLLHVEHVRFLGAAKNLIQNSKGCYLIVGIESDARARRLKGKERPVMRQEDRKQMLEGLKMVDEVIILPQDFNNDKAYEKLLKNLKADVYAVSQNSPFMDNKLKICRRAGVTLRVVHEYNPEYSTTKIIDKLRKKITE